MKKTDKVKIDKAKTDKPKKTSVRRIKSVPDFIEQKSEKSINALSLVEGSGESERPGLKKDEIVFRNSSSAVRKVGDLPSLVENLSMAVNNFHDQVQRIAEAHGIIIKDFADFEIIHNEQDGKKDDNQNLFDL